MTDEQDPGKPRVPAAQYIRMSTEHQQYSTENQADMIESMGENRADAIESNTQNRAEAVRDAGENKADAIERNADGATANTTGM